MWSPNKTECLLGTSSTRKFSKRVSNLSNFSLIWSYLNVKNCSYFDPDKMVQDSIVIECNATKTRRRLIQEGSDLTLEKAIDIVRTDEISKAQFESMKKRKVPVSIEDKIKGELDRMEQTGLIVIQTVPMIIQEKPNRPWAKIGRDLFEFNGSHYLLSVDYYSRWIEIGKLDNLTSNNVICQM